MKPRELQNRTARILREIQGDEELRRFIDVSLPVPQPYGLEADIRLIILGQDPTVKRVASRKSIRVTLNLDCNGSLRRYLERVCASLGIDLDKQVFATNLVKNFFIQPPARWPRSILARAAVYWESLLQAELDLAPEAPVLSLGEPLLQVIAIPPTPSRVREYWGYEKGASRGEVSEFGYLGPENSILRRTVFPLPHAPSLTKRFYRNTLEDYLAFIARTTGLVSLRP